ncbi:hypothetical protein, partial [Klebsiella pneumoniae]
SIPQVKFDGIDYPITDFYRLAHRRMFGPTAERSLITAIIPKEISNINTVVTTVFKNTNELTNFATATHSLVYDFYLRTSGRSDLYGAQLARFPYID